jgi:tRNA pseudouridine32 synthase/23S rRNA pseudouridine746 synthase
MTCVHPLKTDLPKPAYFTDPFCYEPHPLCLLAAEEVKQELARMSLTEGKMFGVMIVESERSLGFLAAYSGLLEGRNDWPYFVPPVFDAQQPDGYFKTKEREIMQSADHKELSLSLQLWLFQQYRLLNARGETKDLVEIWQDYHSAPRIRSRYPLPPGGTGDCCAPKLLQYAYLHHLTPVCMAEFWWGESPKSLIRHHGQFYPACRGKCKPVLTWMLQGLDVDPHTDAADAVYPEPAIIYEDEAMAVLSKPAGMLSVPGKTDDDSVAAWAQRRWPGALLVHRLDMLTSGILLAAKTMEVYQQLQQQFTDRTVKKKYLAIVEGSPAKEHGIIDLPLASDPMNRPLQVVDPENGKRAITEYRVLQAGQHSLLALWPHTGRTHQLRMHCAHPEGLGCPIVGDELYGRKADRLYLQAQAISFVHPTTGKRMHFELPYPFEQFLPYQY